MRLIFVETTIMLFCRKLYIQINITKRILLTDFLTLKNFPMINNIITMHVPQWSQYNS